MEKFLAHITLAEGKRVEQTLAEHCMNVAKYAGEVLSSVGLYNTAYLAGLIHDMGKAKREFQVYLENGFAGKEVQRGSVNHTFAAVVYLLEHYQNGTPQEHITCEVIAYACGAHHGLFDCVNLEGKNGFLHRMRKDKDSFYYKESVENFFNCVAGKEEIDLLFEKASLEINRFLTQAYGFIKNLKTENSEKDDLYNFLSGMLVRLILSAVIYADRRDTSEFMNQTKPKENDFFDWNITEARFEKEMEKFSPDTEINQIRGEISHQCYDFAQRQTGTYLLNVPTGAGKTLCSLRYGLKHALQHQKKRIIFIIPLLSVLEQNAKVIKNYVGDDNLVLEHHSNVVQEKSNGEDLDSFELATVNWDKPIVISTLVQFLNILFSGKTSAVARLQSLVDSVIIIDEIQSLPKKATLMFNMAINFLQVFCNATIVLSSATQPCFDETAWPIKYADTPDMVSLSPKQKDVFDRATIKNKVSSHGMTKDDLATFCKELISSNRSLLVICNTKKEAAEIFEKIKNAGNLDVYHLSTSMCQNHRENALREINQKLKVLQNDRIKADVRPLVCVSTQLVEAGIDFSFKAVVRVLAGIDNLAQAAGRCNRSNEYSEKGMVYLVKLREESKSLAMLPDISIAQVCTERVLEFNEGESLIGDKAVNKFYKSLFWETKDKTGFPIELYGETFYLSRLLANDFGTKANPLGKDNIIMTCGDKEENRNFFFKQPFAEVGRQFHVFEENTVDVIVPYEAGIQLIRKLRDMDRNYYSMGEVKHLLNQIKPYTVSLFQWQQKKLDEAGLLEPLFDGRVLILDEQAYDREFLGLKVITEQPVSNYFV